MSCLLPDAVRKHRADLSFTLVALQVDLLPLDATLSNAQLAWMAAFAAALPQPEPNVPDSTIAAGQCVLSGSLAQLSRFRDLRITIC